MSEHSDVIIVGAGPGGLSCAMLLAKAGVKVTILEKTGEVGGRTKVFEKDGYKFDNCLLYTSPSPRDKRQSRMPSSA